MIKGIIMTSEFAVQDLYIRKARRTAVESSSIHITLPPGWATHGEKICIAVKDSNTLIVTKKIG